MCYNKRWLSCQTPQVAGLLLPACLQCPVADTHVKDVDVLCFGVAVHTQVLKSDDWAKDAAFTDLEAHKEQVSAPRRVA